MGPTEPCFCWGVGMGAALLVGGAGATGRHAVRRAGTLGANEALAALGVHLAEVALSRAGRAAADGIDALITTALLARVTGVPSWDTGWNLVASAMGATEPRGVGNGAALLVSGARPAVRHAVRRADTGAAGVVTDQAFAAIFDAHARASRNDAIGGRHTKPFGRAREIGAAIGRRRTCGSGSGAHGGVSATGVGNRVYAGLRG